MATPPPMIFRREALDYRLKTQTQRPAPMTWPALMARHIRLACWLLVALLGLGGILACLPTVPVSATGPAIVTPRGSATGAPLVAVLMPARDLHRLQPGTAATLDLGPNEDTGTIAVVEPAPLSRAQVAQRLGLPPSALSALAGPVALVWVTSDPTSSPTTVPGTAGQATLRAGTRRAGKFLPLVGRLF